MYINRDAIIIFACCVMFTKYVMQSQGFVEYISVSLCAMERREQLEMKWHLVKLHRELRPFVSKIN